MINKIGLICLMVLSSSAFAYTEPTASVESVMQMAAPRKVHRCMMRAWKAAKPTPDQNTQAKQFMTDAHAVLDQNKAAIEAAATALKASWMAHPIVAADVDTNHMALHDAAVPVVKAFRGAAINIINLLSADQRKAYDGRFVKCIERKHKKK